MAVKTIDDVELVATGTWNASTGRATITRDDLAAILAAHDDGLVDHAPIKLGHTSTLNDGIGEGNPAYGWAIPRRIEDRPDGTSVLRGDLAGVPAKLADAIPHGYRRRSAEIAFNARAHTGKKYRAVLTGLAVLGVAAPAVKTLADVLAYYSDEDTLQPVTVDLSAPGDTPPVPHTDTAPRNDGDMSHPAADSKDVTMPLTEAQVRAALNLDATADLDAELTQYLESRKPKDGDKPAEVNPAPDNATVKTDAPQTATQAAAEGEVPAADPTAAAKEQAQPATVTLSQGAYDELVQSAQLAREHRAADLARDALKAGKITAAEVAAYSEAARDNYDSTARLLDSLGVKFSTTEAGHDNAPTATPANDALDRWVETGELTY
ncbi:hypothetical protein [uncultured Arsenicicoccus sp.]|uniref:hypothetical protein n=1 Tax=uncultured Arsenicicoccus sp. TaxID=491339 RepID=UPI00259147A6|nr:hypothetical protein [uncultured Arsenicicoccus sp.]